MAQEIEYLIAMLLVIDKIHILDFKDEDGVGNLTPEKLKVGILDPGQVLF